MAVAIVRTAMTTFLEMTVSENIIWMKFLYRNDFFNFYKGGY